MINFNWSKEAAQEWDKRASDWSERSQHMWDTGSRKQIIPLINKYIKKNQYVLDIGCGDGYGTYKLYQQEYQVTAIDLSQEMVRYAKQRLPASVTVIQGDVNHLPFDNGTFDGLMAINVLEWTESPKNALKELKRVVKPRGFLCASILGPTAGPRINSYPRLHEQKIICNTMMPWEFHKLCLELDLAYIDGLGVFKQGVKQKNYENLSLELQQALSFSWIFMLRNGDSNEQ